MPNSIKYVIPDVCPIVLNMLFLMYANSIKYVIPDVCPIVLNMLFLMYVQ